MTNPLLANFWNETRLRSSLATVPSPADAPDPGVSIVWRRVAEVLGLGYGERSGAVITKGKTLMRARTTPSAGALYPFEVLVAFQGAHDYVLYQYDVAGCSLRRMTAVDRREIAAVLATEAPATDELPAAVVAVVGRPWHAMRKYGRRGYLYTHLDGAHAATNIALAGADAGFAAVVRLRFDRGEVSRVFGLEDLCREPQALVTLDASAQRGPAGSRPAQGGAGGVRTANPFALPIWRHDSGSHLEEPDPSEREAWGLVSPVSTYHQPRVLPLRFGRTASVRPSGGPRGGGFPGDAAPGGAVDGSAAPVALAGRDGGLPEDLGPVVLGRQSAKGFLAKPLDADALGRALAAVRGGVTVDCADGPLAGLRLLVRSVDGVPSGAYEYDAEGHRLLPVGGDGGSEQAVVASCMNQGVAANCAVVLALHAPVGQLLGERGQQGLAELHFHAASIAQRLSLGAAAQDFGISCLGGFDAGRISDLARLGAEEEVIYVLVAGTPDENAVKWDRAPIAYSHQSVHSPRNVDHTSQNVDHTPQSTRGPQQPS
ncbi:nitroreductase family protein [Kitasatospora sp. MAA19]|uniref:nitroreductase family protein n=1 Tax=Kitasatospora sp. MAA19 TaxID=3035090 RepID=UPI00247367DB|nr:nitroreductase family protein [Kitasatospora sp. MAA19]